MRNIENPGESQIKEVCVPSFPILHVCWCVRSHFRFWVGRCLFIFLCVLGAGSFPFFDFRAEDEDMNENEDEERGGEDFQGARVLSKLVCGFWVAPLSLVFWVASLSLSLRHAWCADVLWKVRGVFGLLPSLVFGLPRPVFFVVTLDAPMRDH